MKTLTTLILILTSSIFLFSQDLIIEYDVTSDKITYRDTSGAIVKRPAAKKNRHVLMRLINFNDYTLDATISAKGINQKVAEGNINLVGGKMLGQESTSFMDFFQSKTTVFDQTKHIDMTAMPSPKPSRSHVEPSFEILELEEVASDKKSKSNESQEQLALKWAQIQEDYQQLTSELHQLNEQLIESEQKIINHKNTILLTEYAAPYVESIKLNERIATKHRKALLQEMMSALFQVNKEDLKLKDILDFFTTFEGNVQTDLSQFDQLQTDFSEKYNELSTFENIILEHYTADLPLAVSMQSQFDNDIKFYNLSKTNLGQFNSMAQSFKNELPQINIPLLFDNIYRNYLEINTNPYEYSFTTPAEGDIMDFEISIFRKDSKDNKPLKNRHIKVPVKGGVKVNSSIGIGFSNYFQSTESYYNRDSTIFAEDGDQFTPLLATLIHFYPQSGRQITVGGSFGVGIPLSGDFKSPSFLLGPSIFAGKSERIVISMGLMGAKATRLAQGYQVNDVFGGENQPIPTRTRYELGYFLSATFNLSQ